MKKQQSESSPERLQFETAKMARETAKLNLQAKELELQAKQAEQGLEEVRQEVAKFSLPLRILESVIRLMTVLLAFAAVVATAVSVTLPTLVQKSSNH